MVGDSKLTSLLGSGAKYLEKAVRAREAFYAGMEQAALKAITEAQPNMGPEDAKYRFGKSVTGSQLVNDNKWHMAQARTFYLAAIARGVFVLVAEQRHTNKLQDENNRLLKEVRDALRRRPDPR
jgi:hypothetical protein